MNPNSNNQAMLKKGIPEGGTDDRTRAERRGGTWRSLSGAAGGDTGSGD
jgi:hypothetical protein